MVGVPDVIYCDSPIHGIHPPVAKRGIRGGSDIVVGCDCIDLNQLAPLDFGLLCSETREQFYASRHHVVRRRYVGIRRFGADSVLG